MPDLASALARGATILTPNQRAARAIAREFNARQSAPLWSPGNVLSLETWLAGLWTARILAGDTTRILLNRTQEHFLWREIIAADPETSRLRSFDALAELAARAWSLVCRYNARTGLRESNLSTDSRAFERWSRLFERRLARAQYMTTAELPGELAQCTNLPQTPLALIDFDTQTPAISALFSALEAAGTEIVAIQTTRQPTSTSLYVAEDDPDELTSAAGWIRDLRAAKPEIRVAVVVPNLEDRRAEIVRVFQPVLAPESLPITAAPSAPVFEFSLGHALADLPIGQSAIDLLSWTYEPLPLERITTLLLSPWFGAADPAAAEYDLHLRKGNLLRPELSLEATLRLLERSRPVPSPDTTPDATPDDTNTVGSAADQAVHAGADPAPTLKGRLRALYQAARKTRLTPRPGQLEPAHQSHAEWADDFRAILTAAGWTRNSQADSVAFQQHRRFDSALDELATLDFERSHTSAAEAVNLLKQILAQSVFAPESTSASVQIIGALEVAGTDFDALWILGADDLAWPALASSSPLVPWQLQRSHGMPGADRAGDDVSAQALTDRIANAAPQVVFSYAQRSDEGERRPSSLLASLNLAAFDQPEATASAPAQALQAVPDDVMLPALPGGAVRGGAQVLKLQAACAFRAFAEQRLNSAEVEARDLGLDARERGSLVHKVMETFWSEVETQANLHALSEQQLAGLLDSAIAKALAHLRPETAWDDAYLRIQRQRLLNLLVPWLEIEAERLPFVVQPVEQKETFQLGPLTFNLRIDRIDSTSRGDLILDYKTGLAAPAQWLTDRPEEPQLPLYAILTKEAGREVAGVAFALLRPGQGVDIKGFADDENVFGKTSRMNAATLADQIDDWQSTLTNLAEAYAEGDSRVLPRDYPATCKHCGQRVLCRLNPDLLDLDPEIDPDANPELEADQEGEPFYG